MGRTFFRTDKDETKERVVQQNEKASARSIGKWNSDGWPYFRAQSWNPAGSAGVCVLGPSCRSWSCSPKNRPGEQAVFSNQQARFGAIGMATCAESTFALGRDNPAPSAEQCRFQEYLIRERVLIGSAERWLLRTEEVLPHRLDHTDGGGSE